MAVTKSWSNKWVNPKQTLVNCLNERPQIKFSWFFSFEFSMNYLDWLRFDGNSNRIGHQSIDRSIEGTKNHCKVDPHSCSLVSRRLMHHHFAEIIECNVAINDPKHVNSYASNCNHQNGNETKDINLLKLEILNGGNTYLFDNFYFFFSK